MAFQALEISIQAVTAMRTPVEKLRCRNAGLHKQIVEAASSVALNLGAGFHKLLCSLQWRISPDAALLGLVDNSDIEVALAPCFRGNPLPQTEIKTANVGAHYLFISASSAQGCAQELVKDGTWRGAEADWPGPTPSLPHRRLQRRGDVDRTPSRHRLGAPAGGRGGEGGGAPGPGPGHHLAARALTPAA